MRSLRKGALALAVLLALAAAPGARGAEWHSEQPAAPGIGVPVPLGGVGDISCWQANRCLLITSGNEAEPAGLYAYDGTGWHLYSTVCGGHEGRIAWAGPDEFWTISDQQLGQAAETAEGQQHPSWARSLCLFQGGRVVASYAEPLGTPTSYGQMDAAACAGPDDCWFAGERLPGTLNTGAFHLHWDGSSLTALPSLTQAEPELGDPGRAVAGLVHFQGAFYESVRVSSEDQAPGEPSGQPFLFHRIVEGSADPFVPVLTEGPLSDPSQEPFRLATDGGSSGEATTLWAAADLGSMTVLRLGPSGEFSELSLGGAGLGGASGVAGLGAEPGGGAWLGLAEGGSGGTGEPARLARVDPDGTVEAPVSLPGEAEGIARKGPAGPIACPATEQCWMATQEGWLFHLGADLPEDTDPAMHALVTYRPPDEGLPSVPVDELPVDDSGAEPAAAGAPPLEIREPLPHRRRARALLTRLHRRIVGGTLLELSFTLRARAHVRLLAKRHGRIVAETPRYTMARGRRLLRLRLDPRRWPTSLDLQAHPAGGR